MILRYTGPMPLDPEFVADCPYGPGGLLVDEVTEVSLADRRVVLRMPTSADQPITREQRVHPVRHPRHVSGGLMVHMTGVAGYAHFYYVTGLRHRDGWVGFGGRIRSARFHALATVGVPLRITCRCTSERRGEVRIVSRYDLTFHQGDRLVYSGDQTAIWIDTTKQRVE